MRWIYISPHLDDAVLSAGGLIHDQARGGERVEIWTLTCGFPPEPNPSPFARDLHEKWGFTSTEETVRLRRAEDERAADIVGARPVHFEDFFDCIYRRALDGSPLYPQEVFVPPHPADASLPAKISATLAARLKADDVLVCPMGIGDHVDHVLVRQAVEALHRPLRYYADVPYVLNHPEALTALTNGIRSEVREVSSAGMAAWVAGIAAYTSQISTLFDSLDKMKEQIGSYAKDGLRLWRRVKRRDEFSVNPSRP